MEDQKNQIVERLKQATNILVAVSTNPSVDQLAGAIGLTLLLNKLNKHATAVFSGAVPSTLEFLQPEKTLEKNTDSLRDFIIALDKSKADKLRYKVEDQMVKIFITPYMTSISEKDLEFSQGDFNVDVVLTLGVNEQQDLDQAITSNGRILHDATVVSVSTHAGGSLGSINWVDAAASSLCEMLVQLGIDLKADVLDSQMATALLTGIVAETNRFSNEKTSSETMEVSAKLMTAGANQQLVASQLQPATSPPVVEPAVPQEADAEDLQLPEIEGDSDGHDEATPQESSPPTETVDGTLQISHGKEAEAVDTEADQHMQSESTKEPSEPPVDQIHIDEEGTLKPIAEAQQAADAGAKVINKDAPPSSRLILEPPTLGGTLTANSKPEELEPASDILGAANGQGPMLSHAPGPAETTEPVGTVPLPPLPLPEPPLPVATPLPALGSDPQTMADLEDLVTGGRKADAAVPETPQISPGTHVNAARDAVNQAMAASPSQTLPPVQALNAQPMDLNLGDMPAVSTSLASAFASTSSAPSFDTPPTPAVSSPTSHYLTPPVAPASSNDGQSDAATDPNAPPPVPPPMMPPTSQSTDIL